MMKNILTYDVTPPNFTICSKSIYYLNIFSIVRELVQTACAQRWHDQKFLKIKIVVFYFDFK